MLYQKQKLCLWLTELTVFRRANIRNYFSAGIKKDCTDCTNDLNNHSAYHFVYHDKCKFCRYSSYRFEGIRTQKEFCEQVEERRFEEKSSCNICYKIFSSEKIKKNHIKIISEMKVDLLLTKFIIS